MPALARKALLLAAWSALACAFGAGAAPPAAAQFRDSIPSQEYYRGVEQVYDGEYRQAQRTFLSAMRGAVKTFSPQGQIRWVDSICYHALLGEAFFQAGRYADALEQFNLACDMYLQYPNWLMQVNFPTTILVDAKLVRSVPPWGASGRRYVPGRLPPTMSISMGQLTTAQQLQPGTNYVQPPELWQLNVVEVWRCTALAIRRRNELLGPLGPSDPRSRQLVSRLSRGGAPANHWSNAWISVCRGLAHAGIGENKLAADHLQRGMLIGGEFDHPLTGTSLVEQGRLAMEAGDTAAAEQFYSQASESAFLYGDGGVLDDAFRWAQQNRFLAGAGGGEPNPSLTNASQWARRQRLDHIAARLQLALAEQLIAASGTGGDAAAATALTAAQSVMGDGRFGPLGNEAAFLAGVIECRAELPTGPARIAAAVEARAAFCLANFQIALANSMFDAQTLSSRTAATVYATLLGDPTAAAMLARPLDAMAVVSTEHDDAFDRWLATALERNDFGAAVEISDRAKRRRFHSAQNWGGRLAAVRDLFCTPAANLAVAERQQRAELLAQLPDLSRSLKETDDLREQLAAAWIAEPTDEQRRALARLWENYAKALDRRESLIGHAAVERIAAPLRFPPFRGAADLQARLPKGESLLVFHDTPAGLLALLIGDGHAAGWNCGPTGAIARLTTDMLRDLGNYDAGHTLTAQDLTSDAWKQSSAKLYAALFHDTSFSPAALKRLAIVPDGIAWYIPFEALCDGDKNGGEPMIATTAVRYAPTAALAVNFQGPWRRIQRTGLLTAKAAAGEPDAVRADALAPLLESLAGPRSLDRQSPIPSTAVASLLDALVVLEDVPTEVADPLGWSPLPIDRGDRGTLADWLALSGLGPQRILLPAMHTLAERGGKASKRRGVAAPLGDELFFASCSLLDAGAETLLLSRWKVGGQATTDLVREFLQEAPNAAAADAWRRSVQVAMETPIDPQNEPRVKADKTGTEITASHPFFWAAGMIVDTGYAQAEKEAEKKVEPPPVAAAARPAAAVQPPPPQPAAKADANIPNKDAAKTPDDDDEPPPPPAPPKQS